MASILTDPKSYLLTAEPRQALNGDFALIVLFIRGLTFDNAEKKKDEIMGMHT